MIDTGTLLQATASRTRRQAIYRNCTPEMLEKLRTGFSKWDPKFYPMGRTFVAEIEQEIEYRRATAAEGA